MLLGLWKSKWEAHRQDMDRRHAEWREEMDRRDAEWRAYRAKSDEQWAKWRAYSAKSDERWAEWRESHAELMARIDENRRETMAALKIVIDELRALRRGVHDLTDAVNANTEAILKLIDR